MPYRIKNQFEIFRDIVSGRRTWKYYHFRDSPDVHPFHRFPLKQAMIADTAKVVYMPIAKNACSSLKTFMYSLSGSPELLEGQDIHSVLDYGETNILFQSRRVVDLSKILNDKSWMRFAVLRHPFDRLVSVYVEKFVLNRTLEAARITIDPVILRALKVYSLGENDYNRGITFRQFVSDILNEEPNLLDPHWRNQSLLLNNFPFTHLYTIEHLDVLRKELEAHCGTVLGIPHLNVSRDDKDNKVLGRNLADTYPGEIFNASGTTTDDFLDDSLRDALGVHFSHDVLLYSLVSEYLDCKRSGRIN